MLMKRLVHKRLFVGHDGPGRCVPRRRGIADGNTLRRQVLSDDATHVEIVEIVDQRGSLGNCARGQVIGGKDRRTLQFTHRNFERGVQVPGP